MSEWGGVRAVVTGSAGFIGSHLVEALDRRGAAVVGIDRRPPRDGAPGCHLHFDLNAAGATALLGDVLRQADAVFHLAALPGVRERGAALATRRRRDNVEGAERVLNRVRPHVPAVVTSSSSVYGGATVAPDGSTRASQETDALRPRGGYAASKVALERVCAARVAAGGIVAVARPFTVAGEGQRPDMAISRWLAAAAAGRPLQVLGGLERTRDVTDVRDVVRGLVALAERGASTTVNLGTGRPRRLAEIVDAVAATVAVPVRLAVEPAGDHEPPATRAATSRCRAILGFVPETDLTALVRRQAAEPGRELALSRPECQAVSTRLS